MAKDRIPYFRFYPDDFMRGIRGLSAQEVGLYTMLLCRMYEESGPIEDHPFKLCTYCGMRQSAFDKTLKKLVDLGKIIRQDGTLFNERAEIEISNRAHDLKNASAAGKASAEKRQRKQGKSSTPVQRPFNHTDTDTDTVRDTNVSLSPSAPKPKRKTRIPPDAVISEKQIQIAKDQGHTEAEARAQFERFKDGAIANGRAYVDWDAAWRNWFTSQYFKPITYAGNGDAYGNGNRNNGFAAGSRPGYGSGIDTMLRGFQSAADRRSGGIGGDFGSD